MAPNPLHLFPILDAVNASLANSTNASNSSAADNGGNSNLSSDENLVALVIAIAAFVISFLQTFLAFLTSSGSREKTSRGALGSWHIYSKTSWDFSTARLRVVYPVVNLDCFKILELREKYEKLFDEFKAFDHLGYHRGYLWNDCWGYRDRKLRWWHIWHGSLVLADEHGDPVNIFALLFQPLALFEWMSFWFRLGERERVAFAMGARATWANMISCFDLPANQAKDLITTHELATGIPSSIDAPWQRTSLANIALIAFVLGLREVDINTKEGIITARNEHAGITSMPANIPGIPYLVALQGDLDSLAHDVRQAKPAILKSVAYRAKGFIDFVHFYANPLFFQPKLILYGLQNGWKTEHWNEYYTARLKGQLYSRAGNLFGEAKRGELLLENLMRDPPGSQSEDSVLSEGVGQAISGNAEPANPAGDEQTNRASAEKAAAGDEEQANESEEDEQERKEKDGILFWQGFDIGGCPSFLQTLAFMPYHCTCSGFPLNSYLEYFHYIIIMGASNWWSNGGNKLCEVDDNLDLWIANDRVTYIARTSSFMMTAGDYVVKATSGSRSWIFHNSSAHFQTAPNQNSNPDLPNQIPAWARDTDGPIPITKLIHELLSGSRVESLRDYRDFEVPTIIDPLASRSLQFEKTTVEAELYLALLFVEARIAQLWENIITDPPDKDPTPSENKFGKGLASFLALWIEICGITTPFSSPDKFIATFKEVIGSWAGKNSKLCVPEPEYKELTTGFPRAKSVGCQDWFYRWVESGDRKEYMEKMLPYLQLRGILLYHFLCCNGDSSKIAAAEAADITIRLA
jgi:hypothetical protein